MWSIPENGLTESLTTPECSLSRAGQSPRRIENVVFHPVADFLLSSTSGNAVTLWDIHKQQELSSNIYFFLNIEIFIGNFKNYSIYSSEHQ